jgi:hypothetical protein
MWLLAGCLAVTVTIWWAIDPLTRTNMLAPGAAGRDPLGGLLIPDKALLIIAHPDDESMFFVPTITCLNKLRVAVSILCLSNGKVSSFLHPALCSQCPA